LSPIERTQQCACPTQLNTVSWHFFLSREVPGNAELMVRFNRGLQELRESGKITQYLLEIQQPLSQAP
jgi:polar amino acid transport system substrate-binding protein